MPLLLQAPRKSLATNQVGAERLSTFEAVAASMHSRPYRHSLCKDRPDKRAEAVGLLDNPKRTKCSLDAFLEQKNLEGVPEQNLKLGSQPLEVSLLELQKGKQAFFAARSDQAVLEFLICETEEEPRQACKGHA